ncbi:MAG TPA: hydrolase [Prolixibacteraceae bacterium]|jgi:putative hydrolase of the HAD superfamily|nr:hydrolase [Prolixibacteraceae bacterium]
MDQSTSNTTLFLDIGAVLLSNGWGQETRNLAAETFYLNEQEMESRHLTNRVRHEDRELTLSEYLNQVVFYEKRSFTSDQFSEFMFRHAIPNGRMIEFIQQLKEHYRLKITIINNEGRVMNEYLIKKFKLNQFIDFFISSCFVHCDQSETDVLRLALNVTHIQTEHAVYVDDIQSFVDVAKSMGIKSIRHKNHLSTSEVLIPLGLKMKNQKKSLQLIAEY